MKTLLIILLQWVVIAGLESPASAQSPQPMPSGPLIHKRAPEFARWTATYTPKKTTESNNSPSTGSQPAKRSFSRRIAVTKTKHLKYEQIIDREGRQTEKWCSGTIEFSTDPRTKQRIAFGMGEDSGSEPDVDFSKTDFPGFEWISAKTYVDIRSVMGQDCIVFRTAGNAPTSNRDISPSLPPSGGEVVAYIDLKTRMPFLLQKNGETCLYQFDTPPQALLTLPPDIQERLDFDRKHEQEVARMPPKPF